MTFRLVLRSTGEPQGLRGGPDYGIRGTSMGGDSIRRTARRLTAFVTGTALLGGFAVSVVVAAPPAAAGTTAVSTFTKTGVDLANGSTTDAGAATRGSATSGDTVRWALNYSNKTGSTADVSISDPITDGQSPVLTSLKVPPNFTGSFASGSVQASGSVSSGTTAVDGNGFDISNYNFKTSGGDGYTVEALNDQIYTVFHHDYSTTAVYCSTTADQVCPGWPAKSTYVDPVAGTPIGTGNSGEFATAGENGSFIVGNRLYWGVESATGDASGFRVGVQCLNLKTLNSCGFDLLDRQAMGPTATSGSNLIGMISTDGVAAADGNHYFFDANGNMICYNAPSGPCGTTNVSGGRTTGGGDPTKVDYNGSLITAGRYVWASFIDPSGTLYLSCYDTSASAVCSGYPINEGDAQSLGFPDFLAPVLSSTGAPLGVCDVAEHACYSPSGVGLTNPYSNFTTFGSGSTTGFGSGGIVGARFYTADAPAFNVRCFDFAAWSGTGPVPECTGFSGPANPRNYTVRPLRDVAGCLAADGDTGNIDLFDATTGAPCAGADQDVSVTPSEYYCDGGAGHVRSWGAVTLGNLTGSEFDRATLTLLGSDGTVVPGWSNVPFPAGGTSIDISALPVSGNTAKLTARVSLVAVSDRPAVHGAAVHLSWNGDPIQICYETTMPTTVCGQTLAVNNVATAVTTAGATTDAPGGNSSGTAGFDVVAPPATCPAMNLDKSGPASSPDPNGTFTYTLLARNDGDGQADGYTVTDAAPAGVTFVSSPTPGCTVANNTLTCVENRAVAPHTADTLPITVTATAPPTYGVCFDNTAQVTASYAGAPTVASNTVHTCNTPKQQSLVKSALTQDGTPNAPPGTVVKYTLTVTNTGPGEYTAQDPATATDNLIDVLDDATYNGDVVTTYSSGSGPAATVNGNTLSWAGPITPNGGTVTITYSVTVNDPDTGNHHLINVCAPSCTGTDTPVPTLNVIKVASTTVAKPGDVVTYTITATNNGPGDWTKQTPATFTDDLSNVLDDATYNHDLQGAGATISGSSLSYSAALTAGTTVVITYSVTINQPDTGDHQLVNTLVCQPYTPVCPGTTTKIRDLVVTKVASTTATQPGSTVTYTITATNTGTADWTAADPASLTDDLSDVLDDATYNGDASSGATVSGTTLTWSGGIPANGGAVTINYSVTVKQPDTGNHRLINTITKVGGFSCPPGNCPRSTITDVRDLVVTKVVSTTATQPGSKVTYSITATNTGTADWTAAAPASLTDDLSDVLDDATYNGDASSGATVSGTTLTWSGGIPANGGAVTINYSVTVNDPDTGNHRMVNTITKVGGFSCPPGNCPRSTITDVRDLHVTKTASRANAAPGSTVTYTITVSNPGTSDWTNADPAVISDDMTNVLDDASYNGDVVVSGTSVLPTYSAPVLKWSGPLAAGASFSITYSITIKKPDTGDHDVLNAVVASVGNCRAGSTDPSCKSAPQVPNLHLTKQASSANAAPGTKVTYTITVANTGTGAWTDDEPASLTDDLGGLLDDAVYDGDATASTSVQGHAVAAPAVASSVLSWSGPLAAGDSFTITYSVTIDNPDDGDHQLTNVVVGVTGNCAEGSTDPACMSSTLVPDMTVSKTSSTTNAVPGSTVTYTITVKNSGAGDWTAQTPASFTDDLTDVLDDATYDGTTTITGASVPATTYSAPLLSWLGPLAAGDSFTVTYSVTVKNPDTGNHRLNNAANTPYGHCIPGPDQDPDCRAKETLIPDLHISKTSSSTNAIPGSTVSYTITVTNSGTGAWTDQDPASFRDSLADVIDDAAYNGDATASATAKGSTVPAPTYAEPTISWSGPLVAGDSFTVTYSVTIDNPDTGNHALDNVVQSPYGNCIPGPGQDADCKAPETKIPDMHVTKTVSTVDAAPGSTVTYVLTVTNNGAGDWTDQAPASFTDDLSSVLDDAVYNADAVASLTSDGQTVPAPSYAEPTLSWSGPLVAGDSFTVTYSVNVANPDTGDHKLDNTAVTPYGNCIAGSGDPDCPAPETKIPDLNVVKTASTQDAAPGSVVSYTVSVTNSGAGDWTDDMPASLTDDLTAVLDDATYGNDVAAGTTTGGQTVPAPTYTEPTISWSGPLMAGDSFTVTYSVTVNNPDGGDHSMVNTIVDPAGNCLQGSTDPTCSTATLVPDLNVVKTASAKQTTLRGKLTYTLTITNPGQGDWTDELPGTATDDLSGVLDDATYDKDAAASAGTVTVKGGTLSWSGPLPAGGTVTVTYSVTVNDPDGGDHVLLNEVTTPTGNCHVVPAPDAVRRLAADDPMPAGCQTTTPVAAYVVVKTSKPGSGSPVEDGQRVTYHVTATNTGQVDLTPTIQDHLIGVLDDASYDGDATATAGTVHLVGQRLVWSVPLAIGAKATLTYSVTVDSPDNGDHDLGNVVTGNGALSACGAGQSVCETHNPTPQEANTGGHGVSSTGVEHLPLELLVAALLLVLGGGLVLVGRRRRRAP